MYLSVRGVEPIIIVLVLVLDLSFGVFSGGLARGNIALDSSTSPSYSHLFEDEDDLEW